MPLKKSSGNMYDWVTHMHTHLGGECPHRCSYCYVQKNRFGVSPRYKGKLRTYDYELDVDYGSKKTIFIEHMNDMFAIKMEVKWIEKILEHCCRYPDNNYVFQTKNPYVASLYQRQFPPKYIIGVTLESNRAYKNITEAPTPEERYVGMLKIQGVEKFITIEPILDFDVDILVNWIVNIQPSFINIGADSKGCSLPEPPKKKILDLVAGLQLNNITIRKKVNLERLLY